MNTSIVMQSVSLNHVPCTDSYVCADALTHARNMKLVKYLQAHGIECRMVEEDTIEVESVYCLDGVAGSVTETVCASWGAVRAYLGY